MQILYVEQGNDVFISETHKNTEPFTIISNLFWNDFDYYLESLKIAYSTKHVVSDDFNNDLQEKK